MNTFDWLSDMQISSTGLFDVVEVRFKNGRKEFYRKDQDMEITTGDAVVVDVPNGHHIGYVSLMGELVRLQMKKKGIENNDEVRSIYRIASAKDLEKFENVRNKEMSTLYRTREIIMSLKLQMKLTDVEYQADNTKATFYYSADDRVDFRELIKLLAGEFRIRVEMRQISLRQEAGRIGGIGVCGRELCCSTWLSDFKSVSTQAARYQNLSLNPGKLSGQCGRLKCCLNYELETYMEALEDIPQVERPLQTEKGEARLQKTDIFRKLMWFGYDDENTWHPVDVGRVNEILELNRKGKKPASLSVNIVAEELENATLNSDLVAMDRKFKKKGNKKKRKKKPGQHAKSDHPQGSNQPKKQNNGPKNEQGQGGNTQHQKRRNKKKKNFKNRNQNNRPE
ncbi:MAG: Signal peptidase-like protein [Cyclobacteriaceae bacterium]